MIIKNNDELRALTSSWYASNDFERIKQDIELETEDLAKIVGDDIIELAQNIADKESPTDDEKKFLNRVALPIALMAVFRYGQSNIVAHDQKRIIKLDEKNEKMPWEWMLDRDDAAHLSKAQRAVDRLIDYLDKEEIEAWMSSEQRKAAKGLFVYNTALFAEYYPVVTSARFFMLAIPLLKEIQVTRIKDALGADYKPLLDAVIADDVQNDKVDLLDMVRRAMVLATIALAVRRLNVQVLPEGLIKAVRSEGSSVNANKPASVQDVRFFEIRMNEDADRFIDKIKRERNKATPENLEYRMLPKNDPKDKFAST